MKKRKRQLNTPQQKQREAQEMSEAAKKRQEEDFARQLAAMFRAELGEEKGETAGEAASRGRDHRRTVVVPNLDRQAEASAAAKKDRASADTATFVPAAAPEPAPAEDPMAHPLNVDRLRADIAESLRQAARREELEQTPAAPQTETEPERSAPSEQAARRSKTRRLSRRERRAARREAQAQKAVPQSEGEPEALRGLDHLGSTGTDAAAPVIRAEDYTPSAPEEERPLTISFDAEPDYIAEVSPSEAPWEEDADWSDARLFSALDQVLSGDAYSEALAALYSTPQGPSRPKDSKQALDQWLAYEPPAAETPVPESDAAPTEPAGAKPPKGMACASEHSSPALPAEPRRGSGAERADSVRPPAPEIPDEDSVRPPEGTESSAPGSAVPESASPESAEPPVPDELPVPEEDDFPEPLPVFEDEQEEDPDRSALSLKELLAAAVPMEAAEPPVSGSLRGTGREEKHLLFMDEELSQEPAEPEPPAQTRPGRRSRSARERGKTAPDRRRAVSEDSISVPDEEEPPKTGKHGSLRNLLGGLAAKAHAPAEEAGPKEPEQPEPVPEESPAPQEPVPSASVKRRRPAAEKPRQRPERQSAPEQPEPQPEPRQEPEPEPEEPKLLYPEDGFRKYAKELGGVGTRLILTGLFSILSLFLTLYLSLRWSFLPEVFSGGSTAYMLLVLLAALLISNYPGIRDAFRGIRSKRFSPMLLILAAALFTALDTFGAAKAVRPTYTVVVGALLMVELWGRYDRGMALVTTLKVLRERELAAGVSEVQDTVSGSKGLTRTVPDVERFMQKLETRDFMDKIMSVYTPAALVGGLVITGLIGFGLHRDLIWTGSLVFLGSVPLAGLLAFPRLFLLMARKLSGSHAAICGFHGAEAFGGEHSILIGDEDIFPAGSLALNGFKVYNGSPDRLIAYAAAAAKHSGSAFAPLFDDLLLAHNGRRYTVDTFRFYDSGGIGATIIGDVVLMGSLEFMKRMGVHMDKGTKVRQAVYMSVNGELAAVFAVKYNPPENLRRGLASIAGNRHFKGILVTRTFLGTPGFLKSKFGIPTGSFEYPDTRKRLRLSQAEMKRSGAQGAILARDSFTGFAQAATGGRVLRSATTLGALLAVLSGAIGLLFMGVLASLPAYETATAVNLLLYILAWLAPTLLLTGWGRHF